MRRLAPITFAAAGALAVLIALGVWQLERRVEKTRLLAQIAEAESQPAVAWRPGLPDFAKLRVQGHWRQVSGLYGSEGRGAVLGAQAIGVLARDGAADVVVLRGWVPMGELPPFPAGEVSVEGWMHPPSVPGWFVPDDDVAKRRFFTLDAARIGAALGVGPVEPFVLVALGPPGLPDPARSLPRPPNDHLNYALTWFGLGAGLVGVYIAYVRKVLRTP